MTALVLGLFLTASGQPLAGYETQHTATGLLHSRGWTPAEREQVASWASQALELARERLECSATAGFEMVLCPDLPEFRRVVRALSTAWPESDHILGVAIPRVRTLVVRGGLPPGAGSVRPTVIHEVVHLVLHEQVARLPRWMDEGIATWLSGRALTLEEEGYLAFLARTGGLYRLSQLERRFPGGHLPTAAAYQQSLHFFTYLTDRYGATLPARLLARAREQATTDTTRLLPAVCGRTVSEVEEDFGRWVQARISWATMLVALVQPWTIASLLAILAIGRYLWRRRRRMAQLTRDDPGDGDASDGPSEESLER